MTNDKQEKINTGELYKVQRLVYEDDVAMLIAHYKCMIGILEKNDYLDVSATCRRALREFVEKFYGENNA